MPWSGSAGLAEPTIACRTLPMNAPLLYPRAMLSSCCALPRWVLLCGLMVVATTAAHATPRMAIAPGMASIHDGCDDMTLATERGLERDRSDDGDDGDDDTHANGAAFVDVDVVVPCAMIDSGALGPDCHDAAIYVVTTHGTPLCRIDLATLAASRSADAIEDGPPASSTSPGGWALSPGTCVETVSMRIPRPRVVELPAARGPHGLGRGRDVVACVPRPS
jgi:hypothetical protein